MDTHLVDNAVQSRFELWSEDQRLAHVEYRVEDDTMVLPHTEVEPGHDGEGLGARVARGALDAARERELTVQPDCTFVAGYIEKHPEYADLLAQS